MSVGSNPPERPAESFSELYSRHIAPLKDTLEPEQRKIRSKDTRNKVLAVSLSAASTAVLLFLLIKLVPYRRRRAGKLIVAVWMMFWGLLVGRGRTRYFNAAKQEIMPHLVKFLGEFTYSLHGRIKYETVQQHLLFLGKFIQESEDYICGSYRGAQIEIADTRITVRGKVLFKGVLIHIHKPGLAEGRVVIKPCDSQFEFWEVRKMKRKSLFLYDTNHKPFDSKFNVYASHAHTAQSLLTEELQRRLLRLNTLFRLEGLRCSYMDSGILIGIPTWDNMFEPAPLDTAPTDKANILRMLKEIKEALSVVDVLCK